MFDDWCSKITFSCHGANRIEFPCDTEIDVNLVQNTLPFIFNSLDDNEAEWQDLRTTWDVESVKIVHIVEESGLMPTAFRISVSFHSYYKPYTILLKVRNASAFKNDDTKENYDGTPTQNLEPYVELHERELDFYKYVAQRKRESAPKVYYMQSWDIKNDVDGILVMQDLIHEGVRQNVFNGFTSGQVKSILTHMAKFHASILGDEDRPELLSKFAPLKGEIPEFSKQGLLEKLQKTESEFFKENAEAVASFIDSTDLRYGLNRDKPTVLVHGTLWTVNVKFRKSWMGSACTDVRAIINWQHCHEGSPIEDVARLIISSTDASTRRKYTDEFLKFYHHELERCLAEDAVTVPFTIDEIRDQFNQSFRKEVLFLMISHIPFLLLPRLYERATDEQIRKLLSRIEVAAEDACSMKLHQ